MESLVFVALSPLAAILMLVVGGVAWRRRDSAGGWALVAFTVAEIGWLVSDTLSVLAPTFDATILLAQATFLWSPLLGVAWLAFVLSYTDRFSRPARVAVTALGLWCLAYGVLALTNEAHGWVWSTWGVVRDGLFLGVTYTLGPLAWMQTVFMWTAMLISLGVILWAYAGSRARDRSLSRWIVAGAVVPMAFNMAYQFGLGPVEKDFTPIAMAVSSGAFALGLARYRFLDLRPIARAALLDNLGEGVVVLDDDGRVVDLNPALCDVFGAAHTLLGRPLAETVPMLAEAIDSDSGDPLRLGAPAGARYFDLRISPLSDRRGTSTGRLVLLHDVTRRREEKAALHRANADFYAANTELQARNDELDAFAHTVAHDLKNSIHGVMGWAEVLRDEGPELAPGEHRELADGVVQAGQKMATIVHELLLLAGVRQATVEPRPMAMAAVVEEALCRVRQTWDLPVAQPPRWPTALGHAPWIEEVWVNYLSNAAKYGGPTVTLGADTTAAGHARFWVHDDGTGLDLEAQRQLFVPFSRVGETDVEGHGLGLSIVRRIAERLGGTCGVESAPEWGTRFWFALPTADPSSAHADAWVAGARMRAGQASVGGSAVASLA